MTDDRNTEARAQGEVIKRAHANAKLKMVAITHDFIKSGSADMSGLERQRRVIELLEYAMTCVPSSAPVVRTVGP